MTLRAGSPGQEVARLGHGRGDPDPERPAV